MRIGAVVGFLVLALTALSVVKGPAMPVNDPALYEYYGLRIIQGAHLYTDLPEVKFPSIYLINALWQLLFGQNYLLHAVAEATLNLASVGLFALMLRQSRIDAWALPTVLFAVIFELSFPQFDYPQHYAVFFVLLGVVLALQGRQIAAGCAIAVAATFWVPAGLTYIALLLRSKSQREGWLLIAGAFAPVLILYLVLIPALGLAWPLKPISTWPSFFNAFGFDWAQLQITATDSGLGPSIGALVALLMLAVRRPQTEAQRFALVWTACALAGTFLPPKWSEHYFLPSIAPLTMAIAAYGISPRALWRRAPATVALLACTLFAIKNVVAQTAITKEWSAYVVAVGGWIERGPGKGVVLLTNEYVPELFLATAAAETSPGAIGGTARGFGAATSPFGVSHGWLREPVLVAYGPNGDLPQRDHQLTIFNAATMSTVTYDPVCGGRLAGWLAIFASPAIAARFQCNG